ncbi:MAG: hypothetical protein KDA44_19865 [Planctomycetales bacterium]|nr:hypothetical protein [Planctomycetales bacterium]
MKRSTVFRNLCSTVFCFACSSLALQIPSSFGAQPFDVFVRDGDDIAFLTVSGNSRAQVEGGHVSHLHFRQAAFGEISGGDQSHVEVHDTATVSVTGGERSHFRAYDATQVKVEGGDFGFLTAFDSSRIDIHGGDTSIGVLRARDGGEINLYEGTVGSVNPFPHGVTNIYGGRFLGRLSLNSDTVTNAYGFDFSLELSGSVFGTPTYRWKGTLRDGTSVDAEVYLPADAEFNFIVVPEPSTTVLIAAATIVLCLSQSLRQLLPS